MVAAGDTLHVLVFGGTGETHELAARLLDLGLDVTLSVASDYGRAVLPDEDERFHVLSGPMPVDQIEQRLRDTAPLCVIDATHPYATHVTGSIATAADAAGTPRLKLQRDASNLDGCTLVDSAAQAAELLAGMPGNVLLTTGAKDLDAYTSVPDFAQRVYPRVLPTVESVSRAASLGYAPKRIIAMQGPFSHELNVALMRQFDIRIMVTKDGGAAGGMAEKLAAAKQAGVQVIAIKRPDEEPGLSIDELVEKVGRLASQARGLA